MKVIYLTNDTSLRIYEEHYKYNDAHMIHLDIIKKDFSNYHVENTMWFYFKDLDKFIDLLNQLGKSTLDDPEIRIDFNFTESFKGSRTLEDNDQEILTLIYQDLNENYPTSNDTISYFEFPSQYLDSVLQELRYIKKLQGF